MTDDKRVKPRFDRTHVTTFWMTDEPCPRCDGMTVAQSRYAKRCVATDCDWEIVEYD